MAREKQKASEALAPADSAESKLAEIREIGDGPGDPRVKLDRIMAVAKR